MPNESPDARVLLGVALDQYVTERTRLVKEARANRDKERATFFQSLKRPTVALWAVLAVGHTDDVYKVLAATTELGEVQAGGSDPGSLSAATQHRRRVLESYVADAVKALAKVDPGAEKRRPEIRALVDQLSRHRELDSKWIDGTLRDLPDDQFGFGAFADVEISIPSKPSVAPKAKAKTKRTPQSEPVGPVRDLAAERAVRAERAAQAREAKKTIAEAARQIAEAERHVKEARATVRSAEQLLAVAEREHASAVQRHKEAVEHHESLR